MVDANKNPLNGFVSETPSTTSVKLAAVPNIHRHIKENGFNGGLQSFHEEFTKWAENLEQQINERIQGKPPVSSGKL